MHLVYDFVIDSTSEIEKIDDFTRDFPTGNLVYRINFLVYRIKINSVHKITSGEFDTFV